MVLPAPNLKVEQVIPCHDTGVGVNGTLHGGTHRVKVTVTYALLEVVKYECL